MPTEEEKRLHRCCFSGHRPEKLNASTEQVKTWLEEKIDEAIADGYATFISGCAMGVDIWAEHIVHIDGVTGSSPVATTNPRKSLRNQGLSSFLSSLPGRSNPPRKSVFS